MFIYFDFVEQFACRMCGTCCRNDWQVTVDEDSYRRNAELFKQTGRSEEFSKAFISIRKTGSPGEYAYIAKRADGGCWFLDSANLCRLHKEAGHDHLDDVCKLFPRYPMSTARGIELTLSFSCPAVINLISRTEPLQLIRSERPPMALVPDNYVVEVYPHQQPYYSLLRYYFELEHHFIDIMQHRSMSVRERLNFLSETVKAMRSIQQGELFGLELNNLFRSNYEYLDSRPEFPRPAYCTPEILVENFFVNFLFKKTCYIYGPEQTVNLLQKIWQKVEEVRNNAADPDKDLARTRAAVMDLEFQYSHNRSALLSKYNMKR